MPEKAACCNIQGISICTHFVAVIKWREWMIDVFSSPFAGRFGALPRYTHCSTGRYDTDIGIGPSWWLMLWLTLCYAGVPVMAPFIAACHPASLHKQKSQSLNRKSHISIAGDYDGNEELENPWKMWYSCQHRADNVSLFTIPCEAVA